MLGLDHFGILAPFYDRLIRFQRADKLIRLAGLPVSGRFLDAGGGTGRVAQALIGQAGQIVVADLSLGMLRQVVPKKGLRPLNSHTEALPFPAGSFDRIIMVDALHHVCDHWETACELWRVLKTGGRLVIEEPDIRTLPVKAVAIFEKLALMRSHFLSPTKIAALFPYGNARTRIEREGYNAWVVVEKQ
jgi:demethylmenaquinone methyltransferase/2-methoxy-6-polyprenyl-1,4-benzoquinol methylase